MWDPAYTVMFTGHRFISNTEADQLRQDLRATLSALADQGYQVFLCGGALGFDTLAAQCVLELKAQCPAFRLHMAIPCLRQDARWRPREQEQYSYILSQADSVHYTSYSTYYSGCMQMRNHYMVENSSVCVAYFNGHRGGTSYTYRLARDNGLEMINLCRKSSNSDCQLVLDGIDPTDFGA